MPDTALIEWLASGAKVVLSETEAKAKRATDFAKRFVEALRPLDDLGPTEELHERAVAERIFAVHTELSAHGIEEYDEAWILLDAPTRAALKTYIAMIRGR